MKKFIFGLILCLGVVCFGDTAHNGVAVMTHNEGDNVWVETITYATITDDEAKTFTFTGKALRIVIKATSTDADGDITISDMSSANYVNLANVCASSATVNYVINSTDSSSNVYGGAVVAGTHTVTLTNCAGWGVTTIYIYFTK